MRPFKASITGLAAMLITLLCIPAASCDRLHEDLQPCPTGARLRFVYDYNMEFANAFPSQVDCLTLLIYDNAGNYLRTHTAARPQTADEDWRMTIDLPAGKYRMLAYGGMDCAEASFSFTSDPETTPMQDLQVRLNSDLLTYPEGHALHHLFYGALDLEIPQPGAGTTYTDATVYMMKDTNDIRILLANENGTPTDAADFEFSITSDNTLMNYRNAIIPVAGTTYSLWAQGNAEMGVLDSDEPATVAYAELSISRLVKGNPTTLLITRKSDGVEVVRIPLINLLMLYKGERYSSMPAQEFLDRENRWNITFFLTGDGVWLRTRIVVNDWIVRINNISEF